MTNLLKEGIKTIKIREEIPHFRQFKVFKLFALHLPTPQDETHSKTLKKKKRRPTSTNSSGGETFQDSKDIRRPTSTNSSSGDTFQDS